MLVFAAIVPHPPIIVPGIGSPDDLKLANKTVSGMKTLAKDIAESDPDTLIIISPHALVHTDRFAVYGNAKFNGDFGNFGAPSVSFKYDGDRELAQEIVKKANEAGVNSFLFGNPDSDYFELDHGEMVPLYYLGKELSKDTLVLPIAYSYLDRPQHYGFGQIIQDVANLPQFSHKRIAIIASGDMSHRLISSGPASPEGSQGGPAGYNEEGKEFDKQIVELLHFNRTREILELDEVLVENAGECGYRSILILLGALDGLKYQAKIISYEGPFGVGYLVANFTIT